MACKNNNTDFWIGKIIILVFFFLFVLSFSNNGSYPLNKSESISVEEVLDVNNDAVQPESINFPNRNLSKVNSNLHSLNYSNPKHEVLVSNSIVVSQLKSELQRFFEFKPKLLEVHFTHLKIISTDNYPSIS